jgi:hypothetical protein
VVVGLVAVLFAFAVCFRMFLGFYTIQPIGALPEGRTLVVWRADGEPFFNSPDAVCLQRVGGVSLMCRLVTMGQAPVDRIVVRMQYMEWAYLASTDGRKFDR